MARTTFEAALRPAKSASDYASGDVCARLAFMRAAVAVLVVSVAAAGGGCTNPIYQAIASAGDDEGTADPPDAAPSPAPAPAPAVKPVPCAGALASWPLDEGTGRTTRDCLGRFPGTLTGAVSWTTGRGGAGHALAFAGGAVALDDAAALRVGGPPLTPAFSAMAWISAKAPTYPRFFVSRSDGTQDAWAFAVFPEAAGSLSIGMRLADKAGSSTDLRSDPVPVDEWMHAAAVFDGQTSITFYVGGVSRGKRSFAGSRYAPSVAPLRIGAPISNNAPFEGKLSDVRLYARALTDGEVHAIASR